MLQKEKSNLRFIDKKLGKLNQIATTVDNTFVVDAQFKQPGWGMPTRKIVHQTTQGKELLQLYSENTSEKRAWLPFQMMNNREVMIFLEADEELQIQVINLQSKHISRSFLDKIIFDQKLNKQIWLGLETVYLFPQTQFVSLVSKEYEHGQTRVLYYRYDQLQEGNAKPVKQYTFQGKNARVSKVNDCSKVVVWKLEGSTITSLTFLSKKEEFDTISNLRCSWFDSMQNKLNDNVNKVKAYSTMNLIECRPDYYFIAFYYQGGGTKYGFLDTSKETKISEELSISTEGISSGRVFLQSLKDSILFYGQSNKYIQYSSFPGYFLDCQQQVMVVTDHQQAGVECKYERFFFPNWHRNAFARVQQKSEPADEIEITVTRLISRFPLKAVSMSMLLHLNDDFDDDLLQDAISMLYEI